MDWVGKSSVSYFLLSSSVVTASLSAMFPFMMLPKQKQMALSVASEYCEQFTKGYSRAV